MIIMAAGLICGQACAYDWSANPGSGAPYDPYQVATVQQLLAVNDDLSAAYVLVNDIDLGSHVFNAAPLAATAKFTGSFDGANHTIRRLTVDTLADADPGNDGSDYLGLFGRIGAGTVQNLKLENATVRAGAGSMSVGGLCGANEGRLINVAVSGAVSGAESVGGLCGSNADAPQNLISLCRTDVTVTGLDFPFQSWYLGGLCGDNSGNIQACRAAGFITSGYQSMYFGGLTGLNIGTVTGCFAECDIEQYNNSSGFGGLCGANYGQLANCYAAGDLDGIYSEAGGFCGINHGAISFCYSIGHIGGITDTAAGFVGVNSGMIMACVWNTETAGTSDGVANMDPDPPTLMGAPTLLMNVRNVYEMQGWTFSSDFTQETAWRMCPQEGDYPRLHWQKVQAGDYVCPDGPGPEDIFVLAPCWLARTDVPAELDDDADHIVDLTEIARLSAYWLRTGCGPCGGADLTGDGHVDTLDLAEFMDAWLYTESAECAPVDLNNDRLLNLADFQRLAENW